MSHGHQIPIKNEIKGLLNAQFIKVHSVNVSKKSNDYADSIKGSITLTKHNCTSRKNKYQILSQTAV